MAYLFGRETNRPHRGLEKALAELLVSSEPLDQAVGYNLLYDARVSEDRADYFDELCGHPRTASDLAEALNYYVRRHTKSTLPELTYLDPLRNGVNIVNRPATFHLAAVLNITSILGRIRSQFPAISPEFDGAEEKLHRFSATSTGDSEAEALLNRILDLSHSINGNRPVWAAHWEDFESAALTRHPDTWSQAVGAYRAGSVLQLVLRYSAHECRLVRPTQLDIGYYAWHFPSPHTLPADLGGFSMNLGGVPGPAPVALVREYIHPPDRCLSFDDWARSDFRIGYSDSPSPTTEVHIRNLRMHHLTKLGTNRWVANDPQALEWLQKFQI